MSVKYIPPSKNVGESVHDINENFAALDKQSETIAQTAANKADATDVQNLATQLNSKADTSDLEAKVSNDQSGATELLNTFTESESTPQNEDSIILKHLNQYVRTPFTALWNWIKSNLAKVATSGSYNDLANKPDIPTVDSSFSESGTNAVAGNVILSALNSKANKTELQALSNQVGNKADADHTHAYLPLAGGTMDNDAEIKIPYSKDGRIANFKGSGLNLIMPINDTGWANGLTFYKKDGTTAVGAIGAFGDKNALSYYYVGTTTANPLLKILPTGQTTITSSTDPLILKRSVAGASSIKFENSNGALGWIGFNVLNGSIKRWDGAGTSEYVVLDTGNAFTTTVPKANGTASAGTANTASRSDHVHPAQTSVSGSAGSLTSKNIGSNVVPVYFDANGKPAVCKYTLGDASAKGVDTTVTSDSVNLITSGGVAAALASYKPKNIKTMGGTGGSAGYICFAQLVVTATYINKPIEFTLLRRAASVPCRVSVVFNNANNTDPSILYLRVMGVNYGVYAYKSATSTWQLYAQKSETYDSMTITDVNNDIKYGITITHPGTQVNTKHTTSTDNPVINASYGYRVETANNAYTWNGLTDDTMTANTTDTRLMVLNGNKVQYRQIDTLPFLSSKDLSQTVLYTSTTTTASATITNLFTNYSLVWFQVEGAKTTHTHILPLAYLKSKGSLTFKDSGTPINILYVSDTQIRWFEYQGQGAETYTSVTIVRII